MIGLPNAIALLRVPDRVVDRALGDADGLRGGAEARALERAERDREAAADLADHVLVRHAHVLEHRLAGRRAVDAELVLELGRRRSPSRSFSTTKAVMRRASRSVTAKTT